MSDHLVLIGACGWQHDDWGAEFYPEDLPEEWQIGYYGNEYQVVMVPASYWCSEHDTYAEWLEESDESLKMIGQWPEQGANQDEYQQAQEGIKAVSGRLLAVLIPLKSAVSHSELAIYKELAASYPLCFDIVPDQRAHLLPWLQEKFADVDYSICWHADNECKQDLELGSVSVTRISGEVEPKRLRSILEHIISVGGPERHMVLIVDGQPPSMQLLENAGIILDLL
ncbi:MAG: hypothetical protein PVG75_03655 [Thioalkalispiraceae bacterium]